MAAERHYTLTHYDGETGLQAPFTALGLEDALKVLHETCGGKLHKPASVSPAMTLGGGVALLAVENGRVLIARDDAAAREAKQAANVEEIDGRRRAFAARILLGRLVNRADGAFEVHAEHRVTGEGLVDTFFQVAMFVQEQLGDVPTALEWDEVNKRLPSIRTQLSRAKAHQRDSTTVRFPNSDSNARFFEVATRPNEQYTVAVTIEVEEPVSETPALIRRQ